jgi:hypothetical protein
MRLDTSKKVRLSSDCQCLTSLVSALKWGRMLSENTDYQSFFLVTVRPSRSNQLLTGWTATKGPTVVVKSNHQTSVRPRPTWRCKGRGNALTNSSYQSVDVSKFFRPIGKCWNFFRFSRNFVTISTISPKIPPKFLKLSNFSQISSQFHHISP